MRLLIYLLAMMTGFSAAEAARPVSATPATFGSAVAQAAVVATLPTANRASATTDLWRMQLPSCTAVHDGFYAAPILVARSSPVTLHDITLQ